MYNLIYLKLRLSQKKNQNVGKKNTYLSYVFLIKKNEKKNEKNLNYTIIIYGVYGYTFKLQN